MPASPRFRRLAPVAGIVAVVVVENGMRSVETDLRLGEMLRWDMSPSAVRFRLAAWCKGTVSLFALAGAIRYLYRRVEGQAAGSRPPWTANP